MSNNNAPDEAEWLLNSLIGADRDYVLAYKPSCRADAEALRQRSVSRLEAIRSQLLPLVRSGLVMKRLEDFVKQGRDINTADIRHAGDGLGGFCVQLKHGYPARKVCRSSVSSLYEAINTALDRQELRSER